MDCDCDPSDIKRYPNNVGMCEICGRLYVLTSMWVPMRCPPVAAEELRASLREKEVAL